MTEADLEYKQLSQLEHVKERPNSYIGSTSFQEIDMFILDSESDAFDMQTVKFTPALLKIIDEIIVNAIDHYTRYPKKVNQIDITFNVKKGSISVRNDGPGIPIKLVDTLNDGKRYQPEAIFSQFLSGSNFSESDRIVGGQNGIGAKAANAFSSIFKIETCCKKKLYKQTFKNRLTEIGEPDITELNAIDADTNTDSTADYTKISFRPDYKSLGYEEYNESVGHEINKLIKTRAYQAAVFVPCIVSFNGAIINIDSFQGFAGMFPLGQPEMYYTTLINTENKALNLEVCIGISDGKFRQISLLNGINVYMGGNHIKHIQNEIVENLKKYVEKELSKTKSKFNANFIINNLFLFVKGCVVNPEFNSQSKEKLTTPIDTFKDYKFKPKEWKLIWAFLEPHVMAMVLGKIKDKKQKKVIRGRVILDKGDDAKFAGDKKKSNECTLVICEGDSALSMITRGINHKKTSLQKDYYGTFSIQGVPINARKESKEIINKKDNTVYRIRNEKLKNNKRFTELVKILGLDYEKDYDRDTDEGKLEFASLRYGRVVVAVDQDEDGKGQIFGLLINFFMFFWPKLADWGFVKRFNTPIIRAYPSNANEYVREFCSLYAFHEWIKDAFNGDDEKAVKLYKIKYYKGLASHEINEIRPMFEKFEKKLCTYEFDESAEQSFETYYGKETDSRKTALATPIDPADEIKEETNISISRLMRTDVKEFQRDNILRKLPHSMDGMVPSRRKAFFAARDVFKAANAKEIKVCNFTGTVISKTNYHHGDASLSETIIKMAQSFVGARNLPLLIGVGEFGSRLFGGKDHGSSRYVFVKLNYKLSSLLYPKVDDFLLPYQFDEGDRCEPTYYLPILPVAVLENMSIPATGWKAEIWARDYKLVYKNVRALIKNESTKCKKLRIWLRGNYSDIRYGNDGNTYIVGRYTYDPISNIVTVTELPPGIYNRDYIKSVAYNSDNTVKPDFKEVYDHSNYNEESNVDEIDIRFTLNPGVMEGWLAKDTDEDPLYTTVEKCMGLCIKINSHINMITTEGMVKEYKHYSGVVNEWFVARRKLYEERITRLTIIKKLQIRYLENIIRFTKERENYDITNKTPEVTFNKILTKHKYDTFDKTLLFNPKYTAIDELEHLIINNVERGTSYEYIITLTYRQLLEEACEKRKEDLEKEKEALQELLEDSMDGEGAFKGQKTWLKELDELEKVIDQGIVKGWSYAKNKPKFASDA